MKSLKSVSHHVAQIITLPYACSSIRTCGILRVDCKKRLVSLSAHQQRRSSSIATSPAKFAIFYNFLEIRQIDRAIWRLRKDSDYLSIYQYLTIDEANGSYLKCVIKIRVYNLDGAKVN